MASSYVNLFGHEDYVDNDGVLIIMGMVAVMVRGKVFGQGTVWPRTTSTLT